MSSPLSPDALTELERLSSDATPGPLRWVNFAQPVVWFPRHTTDDEHNGVLVTDGDLADPTTDTLYLLALWNAAPELLRVCRGAQGDRSLSARMHRETRIITLETEVGRLRAENDRLKKIEAERDLLVAQKQLGAARGKAGRYQYVIKELQSLAYAHPSTDTEADKLIFAAMSKLAPARNLADEEVAAAEARLKELLG